MSNARLLIEGMIEQSVEEELSREIQVKIKNFFRENPEPSDDEVHAFADEMGINRHKFEEQIYAMLGHFINNVGKHNDLPDEYFDPWQLQRGIEVEMEHTNDPTISKYIAKDHLAELKDYYTRLDKMEAEGEEYWKRRGHE